MDWRWPARWSSFHAHPDDEALLVSGTLARAAAEGHRVVVVVATEGEAGLTDDAHAADGGSASGGWPSCGAVPTSSASPG